MLSITHVFKLSIAHYSYAHAKPCPLPSASPPKKVAPSKVVTSQAREGARWDELVKKYQFLEGS